jgi:N-acetylglutamate synthase-like GNAT family acetyltransferase
MAGLLFLCPTTGTRSRLAAELARPALGEDARIASAALHPSAGHEGVLPEIGEVDLVVMLGTEEECPAPFAHVRRLSWAVADPDAPDSTPAQGLLTPEVLHRHRQRRARLAIEARLPTIQLGLLLPEGTAIQPASSRDRAEVSALLNATDLGAAFPDGYVLARAAGGKVLVGAACLERRGPFGVLRSAFVAEAWRCRGIGAALLADRVAVARFDAFDTVYVATEEAAYFTRRGFSAQDHSKLPVILANSPELSQGALMAMRLADPSRTDALLDEAIARELAEHGTLAPPWRKYPEIPRRSIGWRMGAGEWYLWMWRRWWASIDAAARDGYITRWSEEAPKEWRGWMEGP